jgi:hypothetical protein
MMARSTISQTAGTPAANHCPVYAWCTEHAAEHIDHIGVPVVVPSPKHDEPDYLDAFLLHLAGGQPILAIGGADLTPAQARTEAARIRQFADQVDAMADALDATEAGR